MNQTETQVIKPKQLPLYCTGPQEQDWNGHPKVFLPIQSHSRIVCPWCGTAYYLDGEASHH